MTTVARTIDSPIGPLTLAGEDGVLTRLDMHEQRHLSPDRETWTRDDHAFDDVVEQLGAYFDGDLKEFDVRLRLDGTPFQQTVWAALQEIPYGETWSYAELALHVGKPGAQRACGSANGRNPVAIIVPCHRVIAASGGLGGYGGGLDRKRHLLDLEQGRLTL